MEYEVGCNCGKVHQVSDGAAGSSFVCSCGSQVQVPSLGQLREKAGSVAQESSDVRLEDKQLSQSSPSTEVFPPTQVRLRTESGTVPAMVALSSTCLWIQQVWRSRQVMLHTLSTIEARRRGRRLILTSVTGPATQRLTLTFANAAEGRRWRKELETWQQQLIADGLPLDDLRRPEGVALVGKSPKAPRAELGRVASTGATRWWAERGVQLRAAMRGADAVIELASQRCPEMGWGACEVSGTAVRIEDADARQRLRLAWYGEAVISLFNRILLLLFVQAAFLFVAGVFCASISSLQMPTGESLSEILISTGLGLGAVYTWPVFLLVLLRLFRWPGFLYSVALAALAVTTGRVLTVWMAHLVAVWTTDVPLAASKLWLLADPIDWALVIAGVVVWSRTRRLARDSCDMLPPALQSARTTRKAWARGLLAATAAYALAVFGLVAVGRYQASTYVLQPGVDPLREQEALMALNEGADQADRGELEAAERSFQRSLERWEKLTAGPLSPAFYRVNMARTLYNLGWLRERQGRSGEADKYYRRAVEIVDALGDDPNLGGDFRRKIESARRALATPGPGEAHKDVVITQKYKTAFRKYEEAGVKARQGAAEAEGLYKEAIALWEEISRADELAFQKNTYVVLAAAYLELSELQQDRRKRSEAEAALKRSIDYGEKAVEVDPDRALAKHNLEVAREMLDDLREQAFEDEVTRLCDAERFPEVIDLFLHGIEEQEKEVRFQLPGKGRHVAERRLAYRLDRMAWFYAHCPEPFRDTKAAVKRARRATELCPEVSGHWYTLALAHYRNGDWKESLASLDTVKAKEGGFDARAWLLVAMNKHQLKLPKEARAALKKADEWIDEQKRLAEDNALLRFRLETIRPTIDALRREAATLIEGKDPTGERIG